MKKENAKAKESTKGEVKVQAREITGKVQRKMGHGKNHPNLEAEGEDEEIGGTIQKKVGQVKKVFGK